MTLSPFLKQITWWWRYFHAFKIIYLSLSIAISFVSWVSWVSCLNCGIVVVVDGFFLDRNICFFVIYRPPHVNFADTWNLFERFSLLLRDGDTNVWLGDLNFHITFSYYKFVYDHRYHRPILFFIWVFSKWLVLFLFETCFQLSLF